MLFPVILSGGFGGRLWPVSRTSKPKQFIPLLTEHTLLQETVFRLTGLDGISTPTLICNVQHRFIAAEQLRMGGIEPRRIYLEPVGRNTAPAVAIAALDIAATDPDGLMLVLPSDHVILHVPSFHKAIQDAAELARHDYLVTFGILPTAPKTGYGYIRQGDMLENGVRGKGYSVAAFVEKPCLEKAKDYLESRSYLWNSGIFMFKASRFLKELKALAPDVYRQSLATYEAVRHDKEFSWLSESHFAKCPDISIDYAIMEKTAQAAVIPVDMGWSDVGSWGAFWEIAGKDANGNASDAHVYMKDVTNCLIKSEKEVVAALGIDGLIIIETNNALLVAHRDKEQEVKDVFKKLM